MTIQDYGVTYDDLEPHYDRFEYLCGTSGAAGNLKGQILEGGNPFEGPRSRPYPNPPQAQPFSHTLFAKAARELGYKPFPQPSGNMSQAYVNPLGVRLGPCTYCGFCEWFGCGNYSKASPQTTILPVLVRKSNFSYRTECEVTRINVDGSGKRATGVTFVDTSGEEWEQPADLVILAAFTIFNVQLLMLSGIGKPYDPVANQGVIGRNFTHQTISEAIGFFDKDKFNFNPFIASGSIGMCIDEFNGDNFDHGPFGFVGGGYMGQVQTGGRPIQTTHVPPGTPKWGAKWKSAVRDNYLSTVTPGTGVHGSFYSYRDVYLDLDPLYRDRFGRPLVRITMDFHENELKQNAYLTDKFAEIIKAMGAKQVVKQYPQGDRTTSRSTRRRICAAAQSWGPIRTPARSTAICKAGTCQTCSSWARAPFRRTPATTRPARLARLPTGRPTRSGINTSRTRDLSSMREDLARRIASVAVASLVVASSLVAVGRAQTNPVRARAWTRRTSIRSSEGDI